MSICTHVSLRDRDMFWEMCPQVISSLCDHKSILTWTKMATTPLSIDYAVWRWPNVFMWHVTVSMIVIVIKKNSNGWVKQAPKNWKELQAEDLDLI
jgi:hypothetical protein